MRSYSSQNLLFSSVYVYSSNHLHQKYFSHELIKELSISVGTAQGFNQNGINCVEDLIKIADKRMYADKELFYSQANHERRKR